MRLRTVFSVLILLILFSFIAEVFAEVECLPCPEGNYQIARFRWMYLNGRYKFRFMEGMFPGAIQFYRGADDSTGTWTSDYPITMVIVEGGEGLMHKYKYGANGRSTGTYSHLDLDRTGKTGVKIISFCTLDRHIPVELSSFSAYIKDKEIVLSWRTASETENLGFHVYRSTEAEGEFVKLTESLIKGSGNTQYFCSYSYADREVRPGTRYFYNLEDVDYEGVRTSYGPIFVEMISVPSDYELEQCYPNPFNPETTINILLKREGKVTLGVYNINGQLVRNLMDMEMPYGRHSLVWNGTDDSGALVSNGTYFCVMQINGFTQTRKMVFLK